MGKTEQNEYAPDLVMPPGRTLQETLEHLGMAQSELAERAKRPLKTINEIINGKAAITPETALQFERVFGVPSRFWNNLEQQYREHLARTEEQKRLGSAINWLQELPLSAMVKLGWIPPNSDTVDQVRSLLNFFGVASPRPWKELCPAAAFRNAKAFESNPASVAAWLRMGELRAREISCETYDEGSLRNLLPKLRALTTTTPSDFVPILQTECAACGVGVVFIRELPGTRLCGAARWLTADKALVQLSLRYKTNDQLWFTFFHEIGHILLHGKRDYFVETEEMALDKKEEEANVFARDTLISPTAYRRFLKQGRFYEANIRAFASEIDIAPGIVVGRLQHDGHLKHRYHNGLKISYRWSSDG